MQILWPALAAVLSFLFCAWILKFSTAKKIGLQKPRGRDLHQAPVSRLGGAGVVAAFLATVFALAFLAPQELTDFGFPYKTLGVSIDKRLLGIVLATLFLSLVMLRDDVKGVKPFWKLAAQIGAALLLIATGVGLVYLNNPFGLTLQLDMVKFPIAIRGDIFHFVLWADLFLIFWVVVLTNATNFIDGIDGLAGTLCLIAAVVIVLLGAQVNQPATVLLAGVFAGAIAGFLPYNLPLGKKGVKLFLGDTGSMFLGLMLAALTVISGGKLATVLLVFGLVVLDAFYVIAKRVARGRNPLTHPDQTHIHHRFIRAGFSPRASLAIIVLISLGFGLAGLVTAGKLKIILVAVLALFSLATFILLDLAGKRKATRATG